VIEDILPASVVAVDTKDDWLDIPLFPQERAALGNAVESRQRKFITARACARCALEQLGVGPTPIAAGERGEPTWPDGVVGSITHCEGYSACAAASTAEIAGLGIDAEPNGPLPGGVLSHVACAQERVWIADLLRREPATRWDRLLFSAKESVYKLWFPLARSWLGFEDAVLRIDPQKRVFHVTLLVPGPSVDGRPLTELIGRWLVRDGLILTAIARLRAGERCASHGDCLWH
jgi:enterobactin synthetase component D / holo-[acyl-carrier protein] synthase